MAVNTKINLHIATFLESRLVKAPLIEDRVPPAGIASTVDRYSVDQFCTLSASLKCDEIHFICSVPSINPVRRPEITEKLVPLTNARKKPIDSSARKSLIHIGVTGVPSGLRPTTCGASQRENVQTESKSCRLLTEMPLSEVRKNPQSPRKQAVVGKKKPTG
jgi:hypothetical protein